MKRVYRFTLMSLSIDIDYHLFQFYMMMMSVTSQSVLFTEYLHFIYILKEKTMSANDFRTSLVFRFYTNLWLLDRL